MSNNKTIKEEVEQFMKHVDVFPDTIFKHEPAQIDTFVLGIYSQKAKSLIEEEYKKGNWGYAKVSDHTEVPGTILSLKR